MFPICRSANSAQDAESERLEVLVGSTAGAPKCPAPARAAVAASMTHRKQSVPLPLSPIRARCSLKLARNHDSQLPVLLVLTAALWRVKLHPLAENTKGLQVVSRLFETEILRRRAVSGHLVR